MIFDSSLLQLIQKNPLLATGLGVWSAAMLSYFTKDLPINLWRKLRSQFTVVIQIPSNEDSFKATTHWLEDKGKTKSFRMLRLRGGKISAGLGTQYFIYNYKLWWVNRERIEKTSDFCGITEELTIGCFSRSQKVIRKFIETTNVNLKDSSKIRIYFKKDKDWRCGVTQNKKDLNTIFLPQNTKKEILNQLSSFFEAQEWYQKGGIPFRTGLCLYGPPGTGKTSLVRGLASFYNLNIYVLELSSLSDDSIRNLFAEIPEKCMILIEDIDTISYSKSRTAKEGEKSTGHLTLGGLLNAIDGVVESNGRVLVMTTNHLDRLDPALIRPGRCDIVAELSYLNDETFRYAFKQFFPDYQLPYYVDWIKDITPAMLQTFVLQNKSNPDRLYQLVTVQASRASGISVHCSPQVEKLANGELI